MEGRWTFHRVSLAGSYAARFESFLTSVAAPYSGTRHVAELSGEWRFGGGSAIGLAYGAVRDLTDDATLTYLEHGPRAYARFSTSQTLRLAFDAGVSRRKYDEFDPALGARRADTYLDGAAAAELDFADHWTGRFWMAGRKAFSNVSDFAYTQLSGGVTLTFVAGLL